MFRTKAISLEVVLASACLPRLHHSVNIHGEAHWDGGYASNPPVIPLVAASGTSEVLLVQLIPTDHAGVPVTKSEIDKRLGQITFNAPLQKELEAIGMMKKLVRKQGEPTSRFGRKVDSLQLHHLAAEDHVDGLSQASVLNTDWSFLPPCEIRGGRRLTRGWQPSQSVTPRQRRPDWKPAWFRAVPNQSPPTSATPSFQHNSVIPMTHARPHGIFRRVLAEAARS